MNMFKMKLSKFFGALIIVLFVLVMLAGCGEENNNGNEKELEDGFGENSFLLENNNRTFSVKLPYSVGTNFKWYYEASIKKVVTLLSEEYKPNDAKLDGGSGYYYASFEADPDLNNDRVITLSFTYNTPTQDDKHPKTYAFELYVNYEGDIREEIELSTKNLNGPDESEHKWIHHDAVKVTCEHEGNTAYEECEICGERRGYEYFEALEGEHNYVLTSESDTPSKEKPVHEEYTCSKCGEIKGTYDNVLNKGEKEMNKLNILLIGNSYTNYNTLMNCLKGVIEGEGIEVNIVKVSYGSQYLYDYIEGPDGDYYYKVKEAVEKNHFDIVFLQDQSQNPAKKPANFFDSTRTLYDYFTKLGTTCVMYETWARKGGSGDWTEFEDGQRLAASYQAIAKELGIKVSKAGTAVYKLMTEYKQFETHNSDNSHPSTISTYVVALCHYATVYGRSPIGINYKYNDYLKDTSITWHADNDKREITEEEQRILEQVAYDAVFGPSMVTREFEIDSKNITEKQ